MTAAAGAIAGSEEGQRAARAFEAMRADPSLQFAPLPPFEPPKPPAWLEALQKWLAEVLGPLGELLGINWHWLQWILIALAGCGALWIVWQIVAPYLGKRRKTAELEPDWTPDRDAAQALLEDADELAAQGRYDEAAHLLLQRSVGLISAARPDLLHPSSTAREIGALPALPNRARTAFMVMAQAVERSLFALRGLAEADWKRARGAYADFALAEIA